MLSWESWFLMREWRAGGSRGCAGKMAGVALGAIRDSDGDLESALQNVGLWGLPMRDGDQGRFENEAASGFGSDTEDGMVHAASDSVWLS